MSDQEKTKKRNPAGVALFKMQFAIMMTGAGRMEEATNMFQEATEILTDLETKLDSIYQAET